MLDKCCERTLSLALLKYCSKPENICPFFSETSIADITTFAKNECTCSSSKSSNFSQTVFCLNNKLLFSQLRKAQYERFLPFFLSAGVRV